MSEKNPSDKTEGDIMLDNLLDNEDQFFFEYADGSYLLCDLIINLGK